MDKKHKVDKEHKLNKAYFAGGCFWCMEPAFANLEGVKNVLPGYCGGDELNPSYEDVTYGKTEHREAIEVQYDAVIVSYSHLVEHFWKQIDPTDNGGQFADRGKSYNTAIFYQNDEEKKIAEASKRKLEKSKKFDKPIVTEIIPLKKFWKAESFHQQFYKKNPTHYKAYEAGSGRVQFKKKVWG
ncbi:MAG TPA: peptide-methionine (S)-S-oxide reductase MsrA [Candidatus Nanoarchaeia archaeon]|nr:peptide-methionine (S)-S-oxide reductase MsrA [Candidatus Nanoarchaeia archaeon]